MLTTPKRGLICGLHHCPCTTGGAVQQRRSYRMAWSTRSRVRFTRSRRRTHRPLLKQHILRGVASMAFKPGKAYWLSIAAAPLLCLTAVGQVSAQTLKGDWAMVNFDAKGQRYNRYETTLTKKTVKALQLAW